MSPTTPSYLIFITAAAILHYVLPTRFRNLFLLIASLVFYMWAVPQYGIFVVFTSGLCYFSGLWIEKLQGRKKKAVLTVTLLVLLGILFVFKYYNFFMQIISDAFALFGTEITAAKFSLAVPIGISFYTFQVIGYLVDVSNGKIAAERNIIDFALFVTFFPAILSGPIGRAGELLPQYKAERNFDYDGIRTGLQRFLTGAFRKVVLADGIAIIIDPVIESASSYGSLTVIAAVLLYNIKIYCDFAGYSEMAVGAARIFGIGVRENFNVPFFASDMAGFWKRWHMSLTTWLQDYVFTPLVWSRWANKVCFGKKWEEHKPVILVNILIVFLVSGIWHGAAYGYIIWGLLHGLFRIAEELAGKYRKKRKIKKKKTKTAVALGRVRVFLLAAFAHMFFTLKAGSLIPAMFREYSVRGTVGEILFLASNEIASSGIYMLLYFGILAAGFLLMFIADREIFRTGDLNPVSRLKTAPRWAVYWFMGLSVCWFYVIAATGAAGAASFIYFGF